MNIASVRLHPASYRHLSQGHPWVIKDKFTESFRAKDRFLVATDTKSKKEFTLLGDTAHPKIKARLWKEGVEENFGETLSQRLQASFSTRREILNERQVAFLCFGEGDLLPGLFLLHFGEGIVIQSYARYWKKFQKELLPIIRNTYSAVFNQPVAWIAWQERDDEKKGVVQPLFGKMPVSFVAEEFGVKYSIKLDQGYDLGLYPDMAGVRKNLSYNWKGKRVLNLYSYTGAWSLYPLAKGASEVVSVDLSDKYMKWLEENLALNQFEGSHQSLVSDVEKALNSFKRREEKFDFILSDPPSFSSDGKKTQTSMKAYEKLLPLFDQILKPKGMALSFINTHSITRSRFEENMKSYAKSTGLKKLKAIGLSEDCPRLKNFPEGDYLKGILYQK